MWYFAGCVFARYCRNKRWWGGKLNLMASCVWNIRTKKYQNLIVGFQVTVRNVGNVFFETQCSFSCYCEDHDVFWWMLGPHNTVHSRSILLRQLSGLHHQRLHLASTTTSIHSERQVRCMHRMMDYTFVLSFSSKFAVLVVLFNYWFWSIWHVLFSVTYCRCYLVYNILTYTNYLWLHNSQVVNVWNTFLTLFVIVVIGNWGNIFNDYP